jgi:hypothetical protein
MITGSIDISQILGILIGIVAGMIAQLVIVLIQNRAEGARQRRDHQQALAQFRAELLVEDMAVVTDALDEMTMLLRTAYGRRKGEYSPVRDIQTKIVSARDALARASWRARSLSPDIYGLMEQVIPTAQQIVNMVGAKLDFAHSSRITEGICQAGQ